MERAENAFFAMIQAAIAFSSRCVRLSTAWLVLAALAGASTALAQSREQGLGGAVVEAPALTQQSALPLQRFDTLAFRRRGVSSTADALRRMGGTNVRDYGGAGGLKTVSVRGLGATHTQVVLDGLCVGDAQTGRVDLSRFPLVRLRSVALAVGGAPSLLCPVREQGAAVVRLESFLPVEQTRPVSGRASLAVGSFGTVEPAALLAGRVGERLYYNMSGDFVHADNAYRFRLENGAKTHTEKRRNSDLDEGSGEANALVVLPDSSRLRAKVHYALSRRNLPGPVYFYTADNHERLRTERVFAQARFDRRGAWRTFVAAKFDFSATRYRDVDGGYSGGVLRQNYWQREAYATAGAAHKLGRLDVAAAADYVFQALSSNVASADGVRRHTLLGSLGASCDFDALQFTARLVGTYFKNKTSGDLAAAHNGSCLAPNVSALWRALRRPRLRLTLRAFAATAYRAPTFNENYFFHYGSTSLKPERARQLGGGAAMEWRSDERAPRLTLRLTADAYANRVADKISALPVSMFVWRTVNLGSVRAAGLDVSIATAWELRKKHAFLLAGGLSWQRVADYSDAARLSYHHQLAYTPKAAGNASLAWENPWMNAAVSVVAAGKRWTNNEHVSGTCLPAYAEVGLCAYRGFVFGRCRLDLRADVLNLFNAHYEIVGNYPMPGRACKLSANFSF